MSNLSPKRTGLPFVVWISLKGGAPQDVCVKVSPGPKTLPGEFLTVSVRPSVEILQGRLSLRDLELLRAWIDLNRDVLIRFWDGDIEYTEDVLSLLRSI